MDQTSYIKRRENMFIGALSHCHDGRGDVDFTEVIKASDLPGRHLNFFHDDILPPGVSIGLHKHEDDEEYYYIVSGSGIMTLDGKRFEVHAGDITGVFPEGVHGLENNTQHDLRIIVLSVSVCA